MAESVYTVSTASEASEPKREVVTMLATSASKKSKENPKDLQPITPDDVLAMFQAMCNRLNNANIPGVSAKSLTLYGNGNQVAAVVIEGCVWQDGRLVLAQNNSVGNE